MTADSKNSGTLSRSVLPGLAILVLLASLYMYHQKASRLSQRAEALAVGADARSLRGRLLGMHLDGFVSVDQGSEAAPAREEGPAVDVVWFVNPQTCIRCLHDLTSWRELTGRASVRATVILTGASRADAENIQRAVNLGGEILWDRGAAYLSSVTGGDVPPFLLLVLSPEGVVLAAEVGDRAADCGPAPFEHLNALVAAMDPQPESSEPAQPPLAAD